MGNGKPTTPGIRVTYQGVSVYPFPYSKGRPSEAK
jgi:hypothetical protein